MADKYTKEEKQILGQLFRLYRKYYKKPIKVYSEVIPSVTYYRVEKGEAKDEFFYKAAEKLGLTLADPGFLEDYRKIGMEYQAFADAAVLYETEKMKDHITQIRSVIGKRAICSPFREILDHAGVLEGYYIRREIIDLKTIRKMMDCFCTNDDIVSFWPNIELAGMSVWRSGDQKTIEQFRPYADHLPYWLAVLGSQYAYLDDSIWSAITLLENNIDRISSSKYRVFTFLKRLYYLYGIIGSEKSAEYRELLLEMFADPEIPSDQKRAMEYNILIQALLKKNYRYGSDFGKSRLQEFNTKTLLVYSMIQSLEGETINDRVLDAGPSEDDWVNDMIHFYYLKKRGASAMLLEEYFIDKIEPRLAEDDYHPPFSLPFLQELHALVEQTKHYQYYHDLSKKVLQAN